MKKIAVILVLIAMCLALSSCGMMIEILDSMLEHEHEYVYMIEPGEEDGTFDFVGRCPFEYCENPVTYIEKNVKVQYESAEGNCVDGVKIVYSYVYEGETYKYTMEKTGVAHKLCGVSIDKLYVTEGVIDSSVPGVTLINGDARCGTTTEAIYRCEICGVIQEILAKVSHKGVWTLKTAPTCTAEGREQINCETCGIVEQTIAAYGHDYNVTIQENSDGTSSILYSCTVSGCSSKNLKVANVNDLVEISRKNPTCSASGNVVYSYTKGGTAGTIALAMRPLEHSLGGSVVSKILNPDGTIDFGITGVGVANPSLLTCGNTTAGRYSCELCNTLVSINVYVRPHHIESERDWTTTAPTCQRQGTIIKECKYCDYIITEYTKEESLDKYHNVLWDVQFNSANISQTLSSGRCMNADCNFSAFSAAMDPGSYKCTNVKATCTKAGAITHNWTVSGVPVQYTTTDITTDHMLNDNNGNTLPAWAVIDEDGNFDYALDAIHLFANGSISCGKTAAANYRCVVCGEVVVVTAIQHHKMEVYTTVESTCTTSGYKMSKCVLCGIQESETIAASHNIEYVHDLEKNTLTQRCTKQSSDCNFTATTIDLSNGNLALRRVVKASTCCEYGVAEYTFFYVTSSGENATLNFTGSLELSSHTIRTNDGKIVSAETLCDVNGYYDSSLNALKYFAGSSAPSVGQTASGYFICESCGEPAMVTVINNGND